LLPADAGSGRVPPRIKAELSGKTFAISERCSVAGAMQHSDDDHRIDE
jgi:hypothetical protein